MAELALGTARPPAGRTYATLRRGHLTWPDPSTLALREDLMQALWRDSATLVGLGHDATNSQPAPTKAEITFLIADEHGRAVIPFQVRCLYCGLLGRRWQEVSWLQPGSRRGYPTAHRWAWRSSP